MKKLTILFLFCSQILLGQTRNEILEKDSAVQVADSPLERYPCFQKCCDLPVSKISTCTNKVIMEHIADNFEIPQGAMDRGVEGTIYVKFVIRKSGKVSDVTILKGIDDECNAAAVKVVSSLPMFNPAITKDGKIVSVMFVVPIRLAFTESKRSKKKKKK